MGALLLPRSLILPRICSFPFTTPMVFCTLPRQVVNLSRSILNTGDQAAGYPSRRLRRCSFDDSAPDGQCRQPTSALAPGCHNFVEISYFICFLRDHALDQSRERCASG